MKISSVNEAKSKKLIQITIWLHYDLFDWVKKERDRMSSVNKAREIMVVEFRGRYAVFANRLV